MTGISGLIADIRNNPRLRWGIWFILAILWLYAILVLKDRAKAETDQYQETVSQIARTQAQAQQKDWLERLQPARLLKVQLESRLWQASTAGLAQAAFQDWLNQLLAQTAVGRPAITLTVAGDSPAEPQSGQEGSTNTATAPDGLWKVKAKVEFDFNPQTLVAVMTRIEANDKNIVLESLAIRKEPAPRMEAVLTAHFQEPKSAGADKDKTY